MDRNGDVHSHFIQAVQEYPPLWCGKCNDGMCLLGGAIELCFISMDVYKYIYINLRSDSAVFK